MRGTRRWVKNSEEFKYEIGVMVVIIIRSPLNINLVASQQNDCLILQRSLLLYGVSNCLYHFCFIFDPGLWRYVTAVLNALIRGTQWISWGSSFRKLQLMIKLLSEAAYSLIPRSGVGRIVVIIPLKELGDYHCKSNILPFSAFYKFHACQPSVYL